MKSRLALTLFALPLFVGCHLIFPTVGATRCRVGGISCRGDILESCKGEQDLGLVLADCGQQGLLCNADAEECTRCGNGTVDASTGEQFDVGYTEPGDGCVSFCKLESVCGDTLVTG